MSLSQFHVVLTVVFQASTTTSTKKLSGCKRLKNLKANGQDSICERDLSQFSFDRRYVHCEHIKRSDR